MPPVLEGAIAVIGVRKTSVKMVGVNVSAGGASITFTVIEVDAFPAEFVAVIV